MNTHQATHTPEQYRYRTGTDVPAHVERIEHDEDGYWAILKPGFVQNGEFTHVIHEHNKRALRERWDDVSTCACAECRAAIRRATGVQP